MQLEREPVDLAGQLGVGLELQFLFGEVVVGLGLLEGRLPVLAEVHRPGEAGDPVGDPQLDVLGPLRPLLQHRRVMPERVRQPGVRLFQLGRLPAGISRVRLPLSAHVCNGG